MRSSLELIVLFIFIIVIVLVFKDDLGHLLVAEGILIAFYGMLVQFKYEHRKRPKNKIAQPQAAPQAQIAQAPQAQIAPQIDDEEKVELSYDEQYYPDQKMVARAYEDNTTFTDKNGEVRCLGGINDQMARQWQIRGRRDEQNDIAMTRTTADTFRRYFEPELVAHSNRCWWEDNPELEKRMKRDC